MFKITVKINGLVALLTSPSNLNMLAITIGSKNTMFSKNMILP